jgi:hypothetical protein
MVVAAAKQLSKAFEQKKAGDRDVCDFPPHGWLF